MEADTRDFQTIRVSSERTVMRRKSLQVGRRKESLLREHGIESERGVALAENEAVAVVLSGVRGVHV